MQEFHRYGRRLGAAALAALMAGPTALAQVAAPAVLNLGDLGVAEGNNGSKLVQVPLQRSGAEASTLVIEYEALRAAGAGSASPNEDFGRFDAPGSAFLPAGARSGGLPVAILGDTRVEEDEPFAVRILSATGLGPMPALGLDASPRVGALPQATAVADFNLDGWPDIAVADAGGATVLTRVSAPGELPLRHAASLPVGLNNGRPSLSLAVGDLNGDGRPDLAAVDDNGGLGIAINDSLPGAAGPSFGTRLALALPARATAVAVADVNGDGRADLVYLARDAGSVGVLLNTSSLPRVVPSFASPSSFAVGGGATALALGELNGDGRPDIAVAHGDSSQVSVLLNETPARGNGAHYAAASSLAVAPVPVALAIGDLDGDHRADLAVASLGNGSGPGSGSGVSVLLNQTPPLAARPLFATAVRFATESAPLAIAIADSNLDGRSDLLAVQRGTGLISVLLNGTRAGTATPRFAESVQPAGSGGDLVALAVGDLDLDGRSDVALANRAGSGVDLVRNVTAPGNGPALARDTLVAGERTVARFASGARDPIYRRLALGDYDGDGDLDAVQTDDRRSFSVLNFGVRLLENTSDPASGTARLASVGPLDELVSRGRTDVRFVDLNLDGRLDLAAVGPEREDVFFDLSRNLVPASVLLWSHRAERGSRVANPYLPVGKVRDYGIEFPVGRAPPGLFYNPEVRGRSSLAVADFDGDGRPDLVVGDRQQRFLTVLRNTTVPGSLSLSIEQPDALFRFIGAVFDLETADLNGDGRPDIVIAVQSETDALGAARPTDGLLVQLNTTPPGGAISFAPVQRIPGVCAGQQELAVGDLDGDGRPDLAVACSSVVAEVAAVLVNRTPPGAALVQMAPTQRIATGAPLTGIAITDTSADGRPDLVVAVHLRSTFIDDENDYLVRSLVNQSPVGAVPLVFSGAADVALGSDFDVRRPSLLVADFDRDGLDDVLVSDAADGAVDLLRNRLNPVTVADGEAVVTIRDDERPELAIADLRRPEGSQFGGRTEFAFEVTLSRPATVPVVVRYQTLDDSAVAGQDYETRRGELVFAPGVTRQTATIAVLADDRFEADDRFRVQLFSYGNDVIVRRPEAVGTIVNDDSRPSVQILHELPPTDLEVPIDEARVDESIGSVPYRVFLSNPSDEVIRVSVGGNPAPGSDYSGLPTAPLVFNPGETEKSLALSVIDDRLDEPTESFAIALGGLQNVDPGSRQRYTLVIRDNDDSSALVRFEEPVQSVSEAAGTARVRLRVSGISAAPVVVTLGYGGSALAALDYSGAPATVTIPAGQTTAEFGIAIANDSRIEGAETLEISIRSASNAQIGGGSHVITLLDNRAPQITGLSVAASPSPTLPALDLLCVVATATGPAPLENLPIEFGIANGVNPAAAELRLTDASGRAEWCYAGANAGQDSIYARLTGGLQPRTATVVVNRLLRSTALSADPIRVETTVSRPIVGGVVLTFRQLSPSARLVDRASGLRPVGREVLFRATGGSMAGQVICRVATDADGLARCSNSYPTAGFATPSAYTASFAGDRSYDASAGGAPVSP